VVAVVRCLWSDTGIWVKSEPDNNNNNNTVMIPDPGGCILHLPWQSRRRCPFPPPAPAHSMRSLAHRLDIVDICGPAPFSGPGCRCPPYIHRKSQHKIGQTQAWKKLIQI